MPSVDAQQHNAKQEWPCDHRNCLEDDRPIAAGERYWRVTFLDRWDSPNGERVTRWHKSCGDDMGWY
jgi:hypothetical protein